MITLSTARPRFTNSWRISRYLCRSLYKVYAPWHSPVEPPNFGEKWEGSFAAVSTPIFTIKYVFWSSRRDLQDTYYSTDLWFQNSSLKIDRNFAKILQIFKIFAKFAKKKSRFSRKKSKFCKRKNAKCKIYEILQKINNFGENADYWFRLWAETSWENCQFS